MRPKNLGSVILLIVLAFVTMCVATGCAASPVCGTPPMSGMQPQSASGPESVFSLLFGYRKPVCVPENHRVLIPSASGWQEVCPCEEETGTQTITLTVPAGAVEMSK